MGSVLDSILVRAQTLDAAGRCRPGIEVNALPPFSTFIRVSFFLLYFMLKAIFLEMTLKQCINDGGAEPRRIESTSSHLVIFFPISLDKIWHNIYICQCARGGSCVFKSGL